MDNCPKVYESVNTILKKRSVKNSLLIFYYWKLLKKHAHFYHQKGYLIDFISSVKDVCTFAETASIE